MPRPVIPFFKLDEVKILSLKIINSNFFNKYFSSRQLRDKIIADKYNISERYLFTESEYTPLQKFTIKQLNHVMREFKRLEYIEKHSNRFWVIIKDKVKEDARLYE